MATPDQIPSDLALEIEQALTPSAFLAATRHFFGYVDEIARALRGDADPIRWTVRVREGSTVLAAMAPEDAPADVLSAVCGQARLAIDVLSSGSVEDAGVSDAALNHLRSLSALTDDAKRQSLTLKLWINRSPNVIGPAIARTIQENWRVDYFDYGTIEGKLEAIQDSGTLQIRIKDTLTRQSVRCHLPDELLPSAFENFRKRVEVAGLIHYDRQDCPVGIQVSAINALPDDADLPTAAAVRGILVESA